MASAALSISILISSETNTVAETAVGSSALIAPPGNDVVSSGSGTTVVTDKLSANNLLLSSADAATTAYVSADVLAVSSGNASSQITSGKDSDVVSSGNAISSLFGGATRSPDWAVSQASAFSVLLANPENLSLAGGNAASNLFQQVQARTTLTTSGNATSTVLDDPAPGSMLDSFGAATSQVLSYVSASNMALSAGDAQSQLIIPASGQAWVKNTESTAMWRYEDYALRWVASIKGTVVGLTDAGLCLVSPNNNVAWHIDTGWSDFGEQHKKRLTYTYVGGVYPMNVKLEVGVDMAPRFYGYALRETRATIGKGLNARYWRFKFSGVGAASILDIRSDIATSARRI